MNTKIFNNLSTVEDSAIKQLNDVANFSGMKNVAGMPDLHVGKGGPIGGVFVTEGLIYPNLIGSDIGCGMSFHKLDLKSGKCIPDKIAEKLNGLDSFYEGDVTEYLEKNNVRETGYDSSLGTTGRGNHFIEIQTIQSVANQKEFQKYNLDDNVGYLLVHSGSRGYGESILNNYISKYSAQPLIQGTEDFEIYMNEHDNAVKWAVANRELIADRVIDSLNTDRECLLDICHNNVCSKNIYGCQCWIHRKGASPSEQGLLIIPGSRGDNSYLVKPAGDGIENLFSLAHGAGRAISRTEAKNKIQKKYKNQDLTKTRFQSKVICGEKDLLLEEAPEAYKNIENVVSDLVHFGFCEIVAVMKPIATFKTSVKINHQIKEDRILRDIERKNARKWKEKSKWL